MKKARLLKVADGRDNIYPADVDHREVCMKALVESQAVVQLLDDRYGADNIELLTLSYQEVSCITAALRLARRRLDEAVHAFFGG